jgi:hypothetical protein
MWTLLGLFLVMGMASGFHRMTPWLFLTGPLCTILAVSL